MEISRGQQLRKQARAGAARIRFQAPLERLHGWVLVGLGIGGATRPIATNGEASFLAEWASTCPAGPVICLDVGANEGLYTQELIRVLGPRAKVHAFEPARATFDRLSARLGSVSSVELHRIALGNAIGELELSSVAGRSQVASLYRPAGAVGSTVTRERVDVATLDSWASGNGCTHIDLLKIDVEGAEFDVLSGAKGLLEAGSIDVIQFEYGAQNLYSGANMSDICDLLGPGYSIFRMVIDGLVPVYPGTALFELPISATNYVARRMR